MKKLMTVTFFEWLMMNLIDVFASQEQQLIDIIDDFKIARAITQTHITNNDTLKIE